MHADTSLDAQPVVARLEDFDTASGSVVERAFFNHRVWVMAVCLLLTLLLGWQATRLRLNASFEKTIPTAHAYIVNYFANKANLAGQTNAMRIAVETTGTSIFDKAYLETLQKLSDEIFLLPGVDRPFMKSLWTSNTRWVAVTEDGLDGNTVIGDSYDGSPARWPRCARTSSARARSASSSRATSSPASSSCRCSTRTRRPARRWTTASCRARSRRCAPSTRATTSASTSPASPRSSAT
jgi:hypothetical protein